MRVLIPARMSAARFLLVGFAACAAPVAMAQDDFYEQGRGSLYLGMFVTDRATDTRLDSDSGFGTDIDFEEDLGFERSMSVARFGGNFYLQPRQRLDFSVFDLSRDASRTIDETIEFGDRTFTINTLITSTFDLTIIKVDYTWAPLSRPRGYLGVNAGLYIAETQVSLAAGAANRESEDLTAPLPVVGIRGEYEITDRITLGGAAQYFKIETDDVGGNLRDLFIGADYSLGERYAVGLAFNDVSMGIRADEGEGFQGAIDWGYDGWLIYFNAEFGTNANL